MAKREGRGRLSRLVKLGSLTGRVTTSYVADRVRSAISSSDLGKKARDRLHIDNAKDIVETMSRMKGAAMKVGQQAAMFLDTLDLPPEVAESFTKLHAEAEAIPFSQIREDIESELGVPLSEAFASFDETPIGTASLAQAHAATLPDGSEVVVKVLHRGVEDSVATDLMALKGLLVSSRAMRRTKAEIDDIFDELRDRLEEELDYLQEAANIHAYRQVFGDDDRVRIPRVYGELSTERVLTMDRLPGKHVEAFLETATPEARNRAGKTLSAFCYEQIFHHRMLHADPHPGNYLFEEDGRVGVIDYGCVKRFDEFWIGTYARIALAGLDDDRETALELAQQLGAWDGEGDGSADALWGFIRGVLTAFRAGEINLSEGNYIEAMRPVIKDLLDHPNVPAPRDVIMLHRSLGGLYGMGRKLGTTQDFGAVLRKHATYAWERSQGRT
jgi:predicted unusual protein kinase regulating ubiquinone biosynthesis (AarF/ABC1/UbiB family)